MRSRKTLTVNLSLKLVSCSSTRNSRKTLGGSALTSTSSTSLSPSIRRWVPATAPPRTPTSPMRSYACESSQTNPFARFISTYSMLDHTSAQSRSHFTKLLFHASEQPRVIESSGHHGSSSLSTPHFTPHSMSDRLFHTVLIYCLSTHFQFHPIAYLTYRFFPHMAWDPKKTSTSRKWQYQS